MITKAINLSAEEFKQVRIASMTGRLPDVQIHSTTYNDLSRDVWFSFGKNTNVKSLYSAMEKLVDFGATSAAECMA